MKSLQGFSLIELTVVLVLISLATALVLPNLSRAYENLSLRSELDEFRLRVSAVSYDAYSSGQSVRITRPEDLPGIANFGGEIEIIEPLRVNGLGVCLGGHFLLTRGDAQKRVIFKPPYCDAELTNDVP